MKMITVQMIRDKIQMNGPSTLWDLEHSLGIVTVRDALAMLNTIREAIAREAIQAKIIKVEDIEHILYTTKWVG